MNSIKAKKNKKFLDDRIELIYFHEHKALNMHRFCNGMQNRNSSYKDIVYPFTQIKRAASTKQTLSIIKSISYHSKQVKMLGRLPVKESTIS